MVTDIEEREGTYGPFLVVISRCAACGMLAEGRVANSRRDETEAKKIAEIWKDDLISGRTQLWCKECHRVHRRQ